MPHNKFYINIPKPGAGPDIEARIQAKARLWDFLSDIKGDIIGWPGTDMELADQLITSSFTILFPHYTSLEVEKEVRNIYGTIKKPIPNGFLNYFVQCFQRYVQVRLK